MATRDHLTEVEETASTQHPRFARYGRLAPFPGTAQSDQVRCSCDSCGSHLLAAVGSGGRIDGSCPVCLSRAVTPVGAHLPAG